MGSVSKSVTRSVGGAETSTTYFFEEYEDFVKWEERLDENVEGETGSGYMELTSSPKLATPVKFEVGKKYRIVGNTSQHDFDEGEVVEVESIDSDGDALAFSLEQKYGDAKTYFYIAPEEVEEIE